MAISGTEKRFKNMGLQLRVAEVAERTAATKFTMAIAAGGSVDELDLTVTATDEDGNTVAAPQVFVLWASDEDDGVGLTADSFSGDLVASTGVILGALTAKKAWVCLTETTGIFAATLTDTNEPADIYFAAADPLMQRLTISEISGTSWG